MKKHYRHENDCLNCGAELQGKYCHICGQENLQIKESFGHMMSHAISDYFHFDHQFFHTLKPLFFSPGKLTNEYMAGRRVQYLHPIKMYIFISLVYFLLLFKSSSEAIEIEKTTTSNKKDAKVERAVTDKQLDSVLNDPEVPYLAKMAVKQAKKVNKEKAEDEEDNSKADTTTTKKGNRLPGASRDSNYTAYLAAQQKLPANKKHNFLERIYNKKSFHYREKYGERAKEVYFDEIKHNMPKMMFLLLPLCALIFKIAFWRNRKFYVEHLIFTFHLHCFIFLYLAVIMLLQIVAPKSWDLSGWLNFAGFLGITWYLYKAFRAFYQRRRWRTISKMVGISFIYLTMFTFSIVVVSLLTALAM
jgi:hypothetical protein